MATAAPFSIRAPRPSTGGAHPRVQEGGEHHRWTVEEYHRLGDAGGFQYGDLGPHETRVELLDGVIVNKYAEGDTPEARRLRWTREMYERIVENGGFDGLHVELINGHILDTVSPQSSPHSFAVRAVTEALDDAFGDDAFGDGVDIRTQLPLRAPNDSEPEPDVAVVPGSYRDYVRAHPSSALLVVEVAVSSLGYDRSVKAAVYAAAGIPEYWIVNISGACIEVYRDPMGGAYQTNMTLTSGDTLAPLARPDAAILVADLLP